MKKKKKGMTLVEVIAVIAIFGIISMVIYSFFGSSNRLFTKTYGQSMLEDDIRTITSVLEDDIKTGKKASFSSGGNTATFKTLSGTDRTITISGVKIIYAYSKGIGNDYIYAIKDIVGKPSLLIKYNCSGISAVEMATLSKNIDNITLTTSSIPYKLKIELNDKKDRLPNKRSYESIVTPRNN